MTTTETMHKGKFKFDHLTFYCGILEKFDK